MKATEEKKTKRIRHCYPRTEIYHRWIHSTEYVYTPKGGHACAGVGNYLRLCNFYCDKTNEAIKETWCLNSDYMIAIIDRDKKRVLITNKYREHSYSLKNAIPDDYEIFYVDGNFGSNPDILQNDEELFKTHAEYLIHKIIDRFAIEYLCLADKVKNVYRNTLHIEDINELKQFVDKYKLRKYEWYIKSFGNYTIIENGGWNARNTVIKLPTIKQIITGNMFNKKEKLKLEQHSFYYKHCYGHGIFIKWLKEHWNKVPTREEAIKYFNTKTEFKNQSSWISENNILTWQQLIENNHCRLDDYVTAERNRQINQSDINKLEAMKKANSNIDSVNNWRENRTLNQSNITYRRFYPSYRKGQLGSWKIDTISVKDYEFPNTQLKLIDKNIIGTSKGATVPLDDAIKKFKFIFNIINRKDYTNLGFDNIKVGIYNLRFIKYTDKKNDDGISFGRKEWLIQIGCHALWLDDIIDFIKYYHLEKDFGIESNNSKTNIKIQIKNERN